MSYGLADPASTDSFLASLGMGDNSQAPININLPEPKSESKTYQESFLMEQIIPAGIGLVISFLVVFIFLTTNLVSTSFSSSTLPDNAKVAFILSLLIISLYGLVLFGWRMFQFSRGKIRGRPDLNALWVYGVLFLLTVGLIISKVFRDA